MQIFQIGVIHSPYKTSEEAPAQGYVSDNISVIEVFEDYTKGLTNMENLKKIQILYFADRANREVLETVGRNFGYEAKKQGVFTLRSPNRPNPINICNVEIIKIEGNKIHVRGIDAIDGSPLIDIKAYLEPRFKWKYTKEELWLEK